MNLPIGDELWDVNIGLKRVPNGVVMMFYDVNTDTITSSCYIPLEFTEEWIER